MAYLLAYPYLHTFLVRRPTGACVEMQKIARPSDISNARNARGEGTLGRGLQLVAEAPSVSGGFQSVGAAVGLLAVGCRM
jgi:hypothetical protein